MNKLQDSGKFKLMWDYIKQLIGIYSAFFHGAAENREFVNDYQYHNFHRMRIVFPIVLIMTTISLVYAFQNGPSLSYLSPLQWFEIIVKSTLVSLLFIYHILVHVNPFPKPERMKPMHIFLNRWGILVVMFLFSLTSAIEAIEHGTITIYIACILVVSMTIQIQNIFSFLFFTINLVGLALTVYLFSEEKSDVIRFFLSASAFTIIAWIISRFHYYRTMDIFTKNLIIQKQKKTLELLASRDTLTGVLNRAKFDRVAEQAIEIANRYNRELSLIMLDLDHFKSINDNYGHSMGDEILIIISGLLSASHRRSDTLFRWGGEEFIILAPETGKKTAIELSERILKIVDEQTYPKEIHMTISIGVGVHEPGDSVDTLLNKADKALYVAKDKGRNRMEIYQGDIL
ncbi:MAG: diguanylate cyclase [Leptospirales bacterium]